MIPLILAIGIAATGPALPAGGRIITTPDLHVGIRPHMEAAPDRVQSIGFTVRVTIRGL